MLLPELHYKTTLNLLYTGDCSLLGVSDDLTVYVEEIYTEDCWIAQHAISPDGQFLASMDEQGGANTKVTPLHLPANIAKPHSGWHTMNLNYLGPRHRGMRIAERILDMLKPISIHEKMALVKRMMPNMPVGSILGLAESFVVAEARFAHPHVYMVCRRVRVAYALPEPKISTDNHPYDYDTMVFYITHPYDKSDTDDVLLDMAFNSLPEVTFLRPMDCLIAHNHLYIADGGQDDAVSRVHIWEIAQTGADEDYTDGTSFVF